MVRWMAMRRTLFVFAREEVPTVQAAVSSTIAATLRRRLISQLARNGSDPPIAGDLADWLSDLETRVQRALTQRGTATGAELAADEPVLQTRTSSSLPRPAEVSAAPCLVELESG
jgi:hypothetical protein